MRGSVVEVSGLQSVANLDAAEEAMLADDCIWPCACGNDDKIEGAGRSAGVDWEVGVGVGRVSVLVLNTDGAHDTLTKSSLIYHIRAEIRQNAQSPAARAF